MDGRGSNGDWTEERIERLKVLWKDGLTFGEIAVQMGGVTRSAVIGKVSRLDLEKRAVGIAPANAKPFANKAMPAPKKGAPVLAMVAPGNGSDLISQPAAARTWRGNALPSKHQCRWPIGDPSRAGFTFCDRFALVAKPYCEVHCEAAYVPGNPSRGRDLQRSVRRYIG